MADEKRNAYWWQFASHAYPDSYHVNYDGPNALKNDERFAALVGYRENLTVGKGWPLTFPSVDTHDPKYNSYPRTESIRKTWNTNNHFFYEWCDYYEKGVSTRASRYPDGCKISAVWEVPGSALSYYPVGAQILPIAAGAKEKIKINQRRFQYALVSNGNSNDVSVCLDMPNYGTFLKMDKTTPQPLLEPYVDDNNPGDGAIPLVRQQKRNASYYVMHGPKSYVKDGDGARKDCICFSFTGRAEETLFNPDSPEYIVDIIGFGNYALDLLPAGSHWGDAEGGDYFALMDKKQGARTISVTSGRLPESLALRQRGRLISQISVPTYKAELKGPGWMFSDRVWDGEDRTDPAVRHWIFSNDENKFLVGDYFTKNSGYLTLSGRSTFTDSTEDREVDWWSKNLGSCEEVFKFSGTDQPQWNWKAFNIDIRSNQEVQSWMYYDLYDIEPKKWQIAEWKHINNGDMCAKRNGGTNIYYVVQRACNIKIIVKDNEPTSDNTYYANAYWHNGQCYIFANQVAIDDNRTTSPNLMEEIEARPMDGYWYCEVNGEIHQYDSLINAINSEAEWICDQQSNKEEAIFQFHADTDSKGFAYEKQADGELKPLYVFEKQQNNEIIRYKPYQKQADDSLLPLTGNPLEIMPDVFDTLGTNN